MAIDRESRQLVGDGIFETEWVAELAKKLHMHSKDRQDFTETDVLAVVIRGLRDDVMVPVTGRFVKKENNEFPDLKYGWVRDYETDRKYLTLLTHEVSGHQTIFDLKLRSVFENILNDEDMDGAVINPGEDCFVLSREFIQAAADLLKAVTEERKPGGYVERYGREADSYLRIETARPMSGSCFKNVIELVKSMRAGRNERLEFRLRNTVGEDDLLSVLLCKNGSKYHMDLVYDMDMWGWKNPLVLGKDIGQGKALELLKRILLDGVSTEDIVGLDMFGTMTPLDDDRSFEQIDRESSVTADGQEQKEDDSGFLTEDGRELTYEELVERCTDYHELDGYVDGLDYGIVPRDWLDDEDWKKYSYIYDNNQRRGRKRKGGGRRNNKA